MCNIISIEGNIGAGKTTFINLLEKECNNIGLNNIIFLKEPVDEWNNIKNNNITILEKFYEDQYKYAFSFQILTFITRLKYILDIIEKNSDFIIIIDRCLLTDKYVFMQMLYDDNKIDPYSFQIYNLLFNYFLNKLPKHKHIYLKSSIKLLRQKISKRNRKGENISDAYLIKSTNYHNNYYENNKNSLLVINMDNIKLYSDDLHDSLNENYKMLINNVIYIILKEKYYNNSYLIDIFGFLICMIIIYFFIQ